MKNRLSIPVENLEVENLVHLKLLQIQHETKTIFEIRSWNYFLQRTLNERFIDIKTTENCCGKNGVILYRKEPFTF